MFSRSSGPASPSTVACSGRRRWWYPADRRIKPARRPDANHGQGRLLRIARRAEDGVGGGSEEGLPQEGGPISPGQESGKQGIGGDVQEGLPCLRNPAGSGKKGGL